MQNQKRQMIVDFEEELKQASRAFRETAPQEFQPMDFGFGPATTNYDMFLHDGIII